VYSTPDLARDERVRASNEGHLYMIAMLENVLRVFDKAIREVRREVGQQPDEKTSGSETLVYVFETLTVEQPQEMDSYSSGNELQELDSIATISASRRPRRKKSKKSQRSHKINKPSKQTIQPAEFTMGGQAYDLEADLDDLLFMIYCFFQGNSTGQTLGTPLHSENAHKSSYIINTLALG
jgi:hypothetical protein